MFCRPGFVLADLAACAAIPDLFFFNVLNHLCMYLFIYFPALFFFYIPLFISLLFYSCIYQAAIPDR
jgi:hypothetical protein